MSNLTPADADKASSSEGYYFDSYAFVSIHEIMLKDESRTLTYRKAMMENRHLFQGKVVLDVGCGSGILSLFAAQAGAAHVYAVDNSAIIHQAAKIVENNKMQDVITLIKGKVEEVTLPVDKVDIIVSEWMSQVLVTESMLASVIFARDKWLQPDGHLFPEFASLYIAAIEDSKRKNATINWWKDVYGFDMSNMGQSSSTTVKFDYTDTKQLVTNPYRMVRLDLHKLTLDELRHMPLSFELQMLRKETIHALIIYFDVEFPTFGQPIILSTGPEFKRTHWPQSTFYLDDDLQVNAGEVLTGNVLIAPSNACSRDLSIEISLKFDGKESKSNHSKKYKTYCRVVFEKQ